MITGGQSVTLAVDLTLPRYGTDPTQVNSGGRLFLVYGESVSR